MFDEIDQKYPKYFAIISNIFPERDLHCFYECDEDNWSERIIDDFICEVHELPNADDLSSIPVTKNTRFLAIAMGDGKGRFNQLARVQGPIGNMCNMFPNFVIVSPNGEYIVVGPDAGRYWHSFPPQIFGLEPFPYWEKDPMVDISDKVDLVW